jgi:hypothetical protein
VDYPLSFVRCCCPPSFPLGGLHGSPVSSGGINSVPQHMRRQTRAWCRPHALTRVLIPGGLCRRFARCPFGGWETRERMTRGQEATRPAVRGQTDGQTDRHRVVALGPAENERMQGHRHSMLQRSGSEEKRRRENAAAVSVKNSAGDTSACTEHRPAWRYCNSGARAWMAIEHLTDEQTAESVRTDVVNTDPPSTHSSLPVSESP